MTRSKTDQEKFWSGDFGDGYTQRNRGEAMLASNVDLFGKIFTKTGKLESVMEFGANIGLNLQAIRKVMPEAQLAGVEINDSAVKELKQIEGVQVFAQSLFDFRSPESYELTFTKGVLIHLKPDMLPKAYEVLYQNSSKFICVAEYYNPTPVEVPYRGYQGKLFKRDFAGELMEFYHDLSLVDYGFVYRRDPEHPQDDITWFLLKKSKEHTEQ